MPIRSSPASRAMRSCRRLTSSSALTTETCDPLPVAYVVCASSTSCSSALPVSKAASRSRRASASVMYARRISPAIPSRCVSTSADATASSRSAFAARSPRFPGPGNSCSSMNMYMSAFAEVQGGDGQLPDLRFDAGRHERPLLSGTVCERRHTRAGQTEARVPFEPLAKRLGEGERWTFPGGRLREGGGTLAEGRAGAASEQNQRQDEREQCAHVRGSRHGQSTRRPQSLPDEGQRSIRVGARGLRHIGAHDDRIRTRGAMESDEEDEMAQVEPVVGQSQPGPFECVRDRCPRRIGQPRHVGRVGPEQREIRLVGRGAGRRWRLALRPPVRRRRAAAHLRSTRLRTPLVRHAAAPWCDSTRGHHRRPTRLLRQELVRPARGESSAAMRVGGEASDTFSVAQRGARETTGCSAAGSGLQGSRLRGLHRRPGPDVTRTSPGGARRPEPGLTV